MVDKILKRDRYKDLHYLLLCFAFTIPLSRFLSVRVLILLLLFSFFIRGGKGYLSKLLNQSWDILLYLSVLIIGLLYSEELPPGLRVIETSLSLFVLTLVFSKFKDFDKKHLHKVFYAFASGLLVACLICLVNASYAYSQSGNFNVFFFDELTGIIDSQPTYLAYYLIAVITFGLYWVYYEKINFSPILIVVFLLFFFLMLMLTGGLTAFVSVLFIFSFFVLKFLLEEKNKMQTLTFGIVVFMIICMFVLSNINLKEKNDYWERFVLWESALKATPDIMWGVGTGDHYKVLNQYYLSHGLSKFASSSYNSHNQFIEILFSNGLIGVLSLLFLLGRPLYLSVRNQNLLGTLIFFPFVIYGMTEVFLGRYQGVVLFALLHQSFVTHYLTHKPSFSLKDV